MDHNQKTAATSTSPKKRKFLDFVKSQQGTQVIREGLGLLFFKSIAEATNDLKYQASKKKLENLARNSSFLDQENLALYLSPSNATLNYTDDSTLNFFTLHDLIQLLGLIPLNSLFDLLETSPPLLREAFATLHRQHKGSEKLSFQTGFLRHPMTWLKKWTSFFMNLPACECAHFEESRDLIHRVSLQTLAPSDSSVSYQQWPTPVLLNHLGLVFCLHALLGLRLFLTDRPEAKKEGEVESDFDSSFFHEHLEFWIDLAAWSPHLFSFVMTTLMTHDLVATWCPSLLDSLAVKCFSSEHNLAHPDPQHLWQSLSLLHRLIETRDPKFDPPSLHATLWSRYLLRILKSHSTEFTDAEQQIFSLQDFLENATNFFAPIRDLIWRQDLVSPAHSLSLQHINLVFLECVLALATKWTPDTFRTFLNLFVLTLMPLPPDRHHAPRPFVLPFSMTTDHEFLITSVGVLSSSFHPKLNLDHPDSLISVLLDKFQCLPFAPPTCVEEVIRFALFYFGDRNCEFHSCVPETLSPDDDPDSKIPLVEWLAYVICTNSIDVPPAPEFTPEIQAQRFREGCALFSRVRVLASEILPVPQI